MGLPPAACPELPPTSLFPPWLQVVRAALHDLLTIQADRHPQNVFIHPSGSLTLIDNVQVRGSLQAPQPAAAAQRSCHVQAAV